METEIERIKQLEAILSLYDPVRLEQLRSTFNRAIKEECQPCFARQTGKTNLSFDLQLRMHSVRLVEAVQDTLMPHDDKFNRTKPHVRYRHVSSIFEPKRTFLDSVLLHRALR